MIVLHDELDLAPGRCKVKAGGGHAGHNGLRSLHAHIGPDFVRVRLGIGHPGHKDRVPGYVLHDFARADAEWLDDLMRGISDGAPALAEGDAGRFMNAVSLRTSPPRSGTGAGPRGAGQGRPERSAASGGGVARSAGPQDDPRGADGARAGGGGDGPGGADAEATDSRPADEALRDRGPKPSGGHGRDAGAASEGDAADRGSGGAPPDDRRSALQRLVDRFR